MRRLMPCFVAAALALASAARADDAPPAPDKSGYNLLKPTPESQLRSLCTDRPTKSTAPCTVDAGRWQVESDIYNVTILSVGGVRTTTELFTNPTLKLGVTNTLDLEVNITPWEQVTVRDHGDTSRAASVGDLFLRAKQNLLGDDSGNVAVAISPFVKVPTASRAIGNGAVEGGVIVPVQFNLPSNWQLLFDPELDVLENAAGGGKHLNTIALVSLSKPVSKTVTLSAELWTDSNFDPAGTVTQVSGDLGVAWIPAAAPTLQLDGGVNIGLNRATPAAQAYVGISHRF
ncbi:MAG: transporter [Caulobacterales bacterium]